LTARDRNSDPGHDAVFVVGCSRNDAVDVVVVVGVGAAVLLLVGLSVGVLAPWLWRRSVRLWRRLRADGCV
jgi:hypothetical protein